MLPADVTRCIGVWQETAYGLSVRADCIECARRVEGIGDYVQGRSVPWFDPVPQETPCPHRMEAAK